MASERLQRKKELWELKKKARRGQVKGGDTYTVKAGDSFFSIAGQAYGDQRYFEALMQANGGARMLRPGQKINLPPIDTTRSPTVSYDAIAASIGLGQQIEASQQQLGISGDPFRGFDPNALTRRGQERLSELGISLTGGFGLDGQPADPTQQPGQPAGQPADVMGQDVGLGTIAGIPIQGPVQRPFASQAELSAARGAGPQLPGAAPGRSALRRSDRGQFNPGAVAQAAVQPVFPSAPSATQAELAAARGGLEFSTLAGVPGVAPPATAPALRPTEPGPPAPPRYGAISSGGGRRGQPALQDQQPFGGTTTPAVQQPTTPSEARSINNQRMEQGIYNPQIPYDDVPGVQNSYLRTAVNRLTQDINSGQQINVIGTDVATAAGLSPGDLALAGYRPTDQGWVKMDSGQLQFGELGGQGTVSIGGINVEWDKVRLLSSAILPPSLERRLRNQGGQGGRRATRLPSFPRPNRYIGQSEYNSVMTGLVNWRTGFSA